MKPLLKPEDFKLTPEEMKDLVSGAQTYLAPSEDPMDDQPLPTTPKEPQP